MDILYNTSTDSISLSDIQNTTINYDLPLSEIFDLQIKTPDKQSIILLPNYDASIKNPDFNILVI